MKLYETPRAPDPRRVRIFLAEKGIEVATEAVDLATRQQRGAGFSALNPVQRPPALVLDDGVVIAESVAICRCFEETQPAPPLYFAGASRTKGVRFWNFLNSELADRQFIAGDAYSIADITARVGIDFLKPARTATPDEVPNLARRQTRVASRPGTVS